MNPVHKMDSSEQHKLKSQAVGSGRTERQHFIKKQPVLQPLGCKPALLKKTMTWILRAARTATTITQPDPLC